ncbi:MAG: hypothetical protein H6710_12595 [Myxococcales bacterium]|nr:hypothetical protein [Myxococcales bacterium]MCB9705251.1 hypothetical protein [Myxococcales bacterium]
MEVPHMTCTTATLTLSPAVRVALAAPLLLAACTVNTLEVPGPGTSAALPGLTSAGDGSSSSSGGEGDDNPGDDSGGQADELVCAEVNTRAIEILGDRCGSCHGPGGSGQAQFDYVTDVYAMIANGKIKPGYPLESPVYNRIDLGQMPPPSVPEDQRPNDDEVDVLWRWIESCIGEQLGCGQGDDFISSDEMLSVMRNDISNTAEISPDEREFIRYFTLSHLYNSGICGDDLEVYRYGLFKLINSLSTGNKVVLPVAVDERGTIYRIDLRDYGWDAALWDLVVEQNPFAIEFVKNEAADLKQFTRTEVPFQTGDWFVATASRPPLYHDILKMPQTRHELEASFGINVDGDIATEIQSNDDLVARAGFQNSNVSVNNRLVERHEFPGASNRVYWLSYDFAGNDGCRNLFAEPLDFCEDGGEIIFNLPNGLQAYMLVNGAGERIDEGPDDIVTDPEQPNQNVINGLSCMGCHAEGMIFKDDEIREHVFESFDFPEEVKQAVVNLHPSSDEFTALQELDRKRFTDALEQIGPVVERKDEPTLRVFKAFDVDVDLRRAAAELGVRTEQLASQIGKLGPDLQKLVDGGTVKRQVFTANFAASVCALNLGRTTECP